VVWLIDPKVTQMVKWIQYQAFLALLMV